MTAPKPKLDDLRIENRDRPTAGKSRWPLLLLVGVGLLAAGGIWWWKRPRPIEVRTVAAQEASGPTADRTVLNASGYVTARRAATVSSKVTGKVVVVMIEEGMKVEEGQVLARLDDTNVKAGLRLAEAQSEAAHKALEETRVRIKEAEQELRRVSDLIRNQIATQADFEHAEAAVLSLKARLEQQRSEVTVAERQVASWQQQLDDTIIRAPFAGIVTSKDAQPGEMISPVSAGGGFTRTGICTIVDMASLEIEIDVNESYINRVESGQPVMATLDAYSDWKIPAKVIAIIPTADRQKSTVRVRVGFDQLDRRILPEMSVKVAFREAAGAAPAAGTRTVSLPKSAIQQEQGRSIVLIVQNGRAERRAVTVSSTLEERALLSAGVSAGERAIVDPPKSLADGTPVKEAAP